MAGVGDTSVVLVGDALQQASEDMASIARGEEEELDIPWRRLRILLDHDLVEVVRNVVQGGSHRGSATSLRWTAEGARFMGMAAICRRGAERS